MSFALSGVATGMNTSAIVDQLMYLEAAPQRQLQSKSADVGERIKAFQGLNARLSSVIDAAKKINGSDALAATKATSSDQSVTVTSSKTADPASLQFRVDALASRQTNAITSDQLGKLAIPPNMSITVGNEIVTLNPASGSMEDVAQAINDAKELGLSAVMVKVGAGDQYVLQVTGKPGAENAFSISGVTNPNSGKSDVLADASTAATKAQDAQITLTELGRTVTSSSNTFEGLMPGVDVTVSKLTAAGDAPVTIGVAADTEEPSKTAKALVDTLNVVFTELGSRTAAATKVVDGRSVVTPGLLGGDSTSRALQSALASAASYPVDGKSPSQFGVVLGRDGKFTFDEAKFAEALKNDPEGTNVFMTKLASRVQETAESYGDPKAGLLSQRIKSEETNRRYIDDQVARWDTRLESRQAMLQRQFSAMETAIAGMNSQQQWLAGQLAGLPTWS